MSDSTKEKHGPPCSRSEWFGDKTDGIEYRWHGDDLDEIVVYVSGKVILHVERMDDVYFWMGIYVNGFEGHCNFGSSSGKAHVRFGTAEGHRDTLEPREAAVNSYPALLAEVERLRAENERLRGALTEIAEQRVAGKWRFIVVEYERIARAALSALKPTVPDAKK